MNHMIDIGCKVRIIRGMMMDCGRMGVVVGYEGDIHLVRLDDVDLKYCLRHVTVDMIEEVQDIVISQDETISDNNL